MIHAVRANRSSFRTIRFDAGLNVVLAERSTASDRKDSRNGLGKSTLIEIIHFCLGASTKPGKGLRTPQLDGWVFTVEVSIGGHRCAISRATNHPSRLTVEGEGAAWLGALAGQEPDRVAEGALSEALGSAMFGLAPRAERGKWAPTFRSLIGYAVRRGRNAFSSPFEQHWS